MQEPWLLHDFAEDFHGEKLRLAVVGYIRPEVMLYIDNYLFAIFCPLASQFGFPIWQCQKHDFKQYCEKNVLFESAF